MIAEEKIRHYLALFPSLKPDDLFLLFSLAVRRELVAGEIYIRQDSYSRKLAYVVSGLIRSYAVRENGEEATIQLHWEDRFFASKDSILRNAASRFIYQAVEPTVLLEMDYDTMQTVLDANPQFAAPRNFFLLSMLADSMERVESFILLSPKERYLQLLDEKPDITARVPDKFIATLLGITPVSLSRMRSRIAKRKKGKDPGAE